MQGSTLCKMSRVEKRKEKRGTNEDRSAKGEWRGEGGSGRMRIQGGKDLRNGLDEGEKAGRRPTLKSTRRLLAVLLASKGPRSSTTD